MPADVPLAPNRLLHESPDGEKKGVVFLGFLREQDEHETIILSRQSVIGLVSNYGSQEV